MLGVIDSRRRQFRFSFRRVIREFTYAEVYYTENLLFDGDSIAYSCQEPGFKTTAIIPPVLLSVRRLSAKLSPFERLPLPLMANGKSVSVPRSYYISTLFLRILVALRMVVLLIFGIPSSELPLFICPVYDHSFSKLDYSVLASKQCSGMSWPPPQHAHPLHGHKSPARNYRRTCYHLLKDELDHPLVDSGRALRQ